MEREKKRRRIKRNSKSPTALRVDFSIGLGARLPRASWLVCLPSARAALLSSHRLHLNVPPTFLPFVT